MRFIRFVGQKGCADKGYLDALRCDKDVLIDRISPSANAVVDFRLDGKFLFPNISKEMLDLLDIGILVYLVDEMADRSISADYWSRKLNCLIPVLNPAKWHDSEQIIRETLKVLSGDSWDFQWLQLKKSPALRSHRQALPKNCNTVCLFSGGIDSLLGALQLLDAGRNVLLVGHQADGQTASAQSALADMLKKLYPGMVHLVQCRVSRTLRHNPNFALPSKIEISHRTRSFLFLTLGVAIAAKYGFKEMYMPENGLMALNIPLQKSRIGSLSTRTAHPVFVMKFIQAVLGVSGYSVLIKNPFLTMSKTDMLSNLPSAIHPLIKRSISCARPARYNNLKVRHCGYCVPCVHRRIALMEANLDSAKDYAFDIFKDFPSVGRDKQQDFRAIVQFALRINNVSVTELQTLVLIHGYFPPDVNKTIGTGRTSGYHLWTDMIKRWADNFLNKIHSNTSLSTQKSLGLVK